jgi:hypothetical protein
MLSFELVKVKKSAAHGEEQSRGNSLPVGKRSVTEFEARVYAYCKQVPAGSVATYGELARVLNSSARAIGQVCAFVTFSFPAHGREKKSSNAKTKVTLRVYAHVLHRSVTHHYLNRQ